MPRKLTTREFIGQCQAVHYGYYNYEDVTYTSNKASINIKCPLHGTFSQQAGKHKNRGDDCPKCAITMRTLKNSLTTSEFIKLAKTTHKEKYDYKNTVYLNNKTKVLITCKLHGDFFMLPGNHYLKHQGCPTCGIKATGISNTYTREEFLVKANEVHKDFYDYSEVLYTGSMVPVIIICPEHGKFKQTPSCHYNQKSGCPSCNTAHGGFKHNKPGLLYYLSINDGEAYKIGITNKNVDTRFSVEELKSIKVIKTWKFLSGRDAYDKEQSILREHAAYKYTGSPLLRIGNTELFISDVLTLDKKGS